MFCSECGAQAAGKFCASCGFRLLPVGESRPALQAAEPAEDWTQLVDYQRLIAVPAVQLRIAQAAAQSKKHMTGEEFLDYYGKALGSLTGVPLPMSGLARFAQSAYAKLGVKTGKSRSQFYAAPPGAMLVSVLCALAREGRTLRSAHQATDGCILVAALPSNLLALEGDLVVGVTRAAGGCQVEARTDIPGQLFDWGKSTRCLEALLAELGAAAAA